MDGCVEQQRSARFLIKSWFTPMQVVVVAFSRVIVFDAFCVFGKLSCVRNQQKESKTQVLHF